MERQKIDPVFLRPISEVMGKKAKYNRHGIKVLSAVIPEKRDGINEWFKNFTI